MKSYLTLLLRIVLGRGFLSAVADRFGFWRQPGDIAVAWGNWENFIAYTSKLNFGVPDNGLRRIAIVCHSSKQMGR